ncbi:MAG: sensory rhodopsin transducer [Terrimicrobiaceae bacterium]
MKTGSKVWIFPDGDIPPRDPYDLSLKNEGTHGHESLVILNTGDEPARLRLSVFFTDQEPWQIELPELGARRVVCHRTNEPLGAENRQIPQVQYSLVLESSQPVVAQLGRMDIRQPNLAYYTVMGHPA